MNVMNRNMLYDKTGTTIVEQILNCDFFYYNRDYLNQDQDYRMYK